MDDSSRSCMGLVLRRLLGERILVGEVWVVWSPLLCDLVPNLMFLEQSKRVILMKLFVEFVMHDFFV